MEVRTIDSNLDKGANQKPEIRREVLRKLILNFVQELYFGNRNFEEIVNDQVLDLESWIDAA
ncbi:hypothetical protein CH370_20830 [Leptospira kmetyi]|uniref:Uncharacterized protein n=1 Tax=Leptospira kmetyi TaxID=408139 RepID=A0ABX4N5Q4_9LEPT|nr:hypothetical protein CH378_16105 [Leptospira kmetyi]PJZ39505.1 hypothetical protein CH370_20830 [Leptospira kmetyi]